MLNIEPDTIKLNSVLSPLHVAVGVIRNKHDEVLISLRHDALHQGGLWEFPGGKVELGETVQQALSRELKEELDINVETMEPLIKISHQYPDLNVLLDVWVVRHFAGEVKGNEGQKIQWVRAQALLEFTFPAANIPIVTAARLPTQYAILNGAEEKLLKFKLKKILGQDVKLIQLRLKGLSNEAVQQFLKWAIPLAREKDVILLINSAVPHSYSCRIEGLHLTAQHLLSAKQRPNSYSWVAASCHNEAELLHAEKIGVDFVVLAPVLKTATHPEVAPLGWRRFAELVSLVNLPVYALGGLGRKHIETAKQAGAQGIAGISAFLK